MKTTATQSDTFYNNDARKAIDGITNYTIDTCMCCSVAKRKENENIAWWQIDLGKKYLIDALSIFGRDDLGNKDDSEYIRPKLVRLNVS